MTGDWGESKVLVLDMYLSDYHFVERAAQKLGYATSEFVLLSASLVASAVANGDDVLKTPAMLVGEANFVSR
ncbi:hypothetical protein QZM99_31745 [Burkholderia gladioli]|uniref:hypothetical protein n=1 Tax=Burkholderia gladioli TaxID=28095 RepID=UPI0026530349|nr:hypothetical protein [Burkholderia gladioli]MDN7922656.1 hypothetical protein [Burkholderia gladioli]